MTPFAALTVITLPFFYDFIVFSVQIQTKYNRLRQLLAEANLEVAHAIRTIDDVPTRTELIQYERRFVELYQQVCCNANNSSSVYLMHIFF